MKKYILYSVVIIIITILIRDAIYSYCVSNVHIDNRVSFEERIYPEYANKIMGVGGMIKNNTMFPIRVKEVRPIGTRGIEYFTAVISSWGFSEATREEISKLEELHDKKVSSYTEYEIGFFYEFTGEYAVNPSAYEIIYTILGLEFREIIENNKGVK